MNIWLKQVLDPQKVVSDTHSFKLIHPYIAPAASFCTGESSNISLVVLDKLLFTLSKPLLGKISKQ